MARIERTKNATRNILFGTILKLYQILVPFLMRTAIIYYMGVQYLGLNSLFSSVLQVLNLAELGVGSAMVYSMYKPIAEDDTKTICALMKLYKTYYRIIGICIAFVGCILIPFIPKLIKGELPNGINVYVLYLINLGATVLSYWLFAYKNSILRAHQRNDVVSKVMLITSTIQYGAQIFVLAFYKNYYAYVSITLATQALTNIITAIFANALYPNYHPDGSIPQETKKEINQRIKDLFTAKLGGTITSSADSIVISAFSGLTILAVYQNYYYIVNSVYGFICILFTAIIAGIGNSLVTETIEKNYNDLRKLTFIICFILCICCCCFAGLFQPFMKIWVGTELMLDYSYVVLLCVLFYCLSLAMIWATIKDAAGLWHSDRFRPFIGAAVNLFLNILLIQYIGLYGVILSTVLSYLFISMPWLLHNLFKLLYKRGLWDYLKDIAQYIIVTIISVFIAVSSCSFIAIEGFIGLFVRGIICIGIPVIIQIGIYHNKNEFKQACKLFRGMIRFGGK